MFRNPFSFSGRIRRLEYGLSYLAYMASLVLVQVLIELTTGTKSGMGGLLLFVFMVPTYWFLIAQGAKRCHDRNHSGWFQLVPFYAFWMIFASGDDDTNGYGPNPKATTLAVETY